MLLVIIELIVYAVFPFALMGFLWSRNGVRRARHHVHLVDEQSTNGLLALSVRMVYAQQRAWSAAMGLHLVFSLIFVASVTWPSHTWPHWLQVVGTVVLLVALEGPIVIACIAAYRRERAYLRMADYQRQQERQHRRRRTDRDSTLADTSAHASAPNEDI